jgi:hypothetical protein
VCTGGKTCQAGVCVGGPCGNGVIDPGEKCDGTTGTVMNPVASPATCYSPGLKNQCDYDFANVRQLYCNGSCSWAGAQGCDQADADILCKLKTGNPLSTALSWTHAAAQNFGGFSCPNYGANLSTFPEYGVNVNVWWQPDTQPIVANHGPGNVILDPICTNP